MAAFSDSRKLELTDQAPAPDHRAAAAGSSRQVCNQDLEGIVVAKRRRSAYDSSSPLALWAKIKNADYSQAPDRHELFERA